MAPPLFRWSPGTAQYIDELGRFVPRATVRAALDTAIDGQAAAMKAGTMDLIAARADLEGWRTMMRLNIKSVQLYSAATARGGWEQMPNADLGRIAGVIESEYHYLENFALDIASGRADTDGALLHRVQMYADAGRATYHQFESSVMRKAGFAMYRNIHDPGSENCDDCINQSNRGWVRLGKLTPIGSRTCLRSCHCRYEYARSGETGT